MQLEDLDTLEADPLNDKRQVLVLKSKRELTLEFNTIHDLQLFRQFGLVMSAYIQPAA